MKRINIAVDAMGGDHGLRVVVPACVHAVADNPELRLLLVGDYSQVQKHLKKWGAASNSQISIVHASEVVAMDELPSQALRSKKDSSMRVAINLVKEARAQACVSAGNTGALMATARFVLKTLPGIDRPAIIAELPTMNGKSTRVLDLGANVDSCAEHLFQFAVMGSALVQAIDHVKHPRVGLLNVGVEEMKGNDQVKHTAHMLAESNLINYVGYVEGNHFYTGEVDLIVCDGFAGNVSLKASEGLAALMISSLKKSFYSNWYAKLAGLIAKPVLAKLRRELDPARYNGASLLGLNGIVVKSHGGADEKAFRHAIDQAVLQVKNDVVRLVHDQISDLINQGLLL